MVLAVTVPDYQWVTIVVALLGVFTSAILYRSARPKNAGEGAEAISSAAVSLVDPLRERIDELVERNELLAGRVELLEGEVAEVGRLEVQNAQFRDRIKFLEMQVNMLRQASSDRSKLEDMLAVERARSARMMRIIGLLSGQVVDLGGDPVASLEGIDDVD